MPRPPPVVPFIQTGNPEMDRLQRFVSQALPGKQDPWVAPKFVGSWDAYPGYAAPKFMKDSIGFVHLLGLARNNAAGGAGTTIFILPLGYRPVSKRQFANLNFTGAAVQIGNIDVDTSGNVIANTFSQTGAGAGNISLEGISFDTR